MIVEKKRKPEIVNEAELLDIHKVAMDIVDLMSLVPAQLRKLDARISFPAQSDFRSQAVELEEAAYADSNYRERAEKEELFENQYRYSDSHGPITYLSLYTKQNELAAFFSIFQNGQTVFEETSDVLSQRPDLKDIPLMVVSKIARHPTHADLLYRAGQPHRTMLALTIFLLANRSENGILLETKAQPATMRMIRGEVMERYFPNYEIVMNIEAGIEDKDPHKILLYFPHMNIFDYLHIAKGIINSGIESLRNRWEG